jgi:branched-subunit amino acid aminotransferase/4-amino-4-deoxychorismate lyase
MKTHPPAQSPGGFSLVESILWNPAEGYTLLDRHLARMAASARFFGFSFGPREAEGALEAQRLRLDRQPHKVRLLLAVDGIFSCSSIPLMEIPKPDPSRLRLAPRPVSSEDVFLYHKTTSRESYENAERSGLDCDEVVLWNERDEVTETTSANLVFELDGETVTPPVSSGLLAGTYREWMIETGRVREKVVMVADVCRASRILVVNSVRPPRLGTLLG